ncbi:MAG: hypothetical protein Kow0077_13550 [Anaerolineae bacterium]
MKIACPKCNWHPPAGARWQCTCGHMWHSFATHGVCPACSKRWQMTQCHACHVWSDHEDWYHDDDDLTVEEFLDQFKKQPENA